MDFDGSALRFGTMKLGDEREVSRLCWEVFSEFEAEGYSRQGIEEFQRFIAPDALAAHRAEGTLLVLCCKLGEEMAGVAAVKNNRHLALLFVRKKFQRQGIARKLLELAVAKCLDMRADLRTFTVNSSRYAVHIYEKMGFRAVGMEQEINGIRFTPMELVIDTRRGRDAR